VVGLICILIGPAARTGAVNPEASTATSPKVRSSSVWEAISGVAEPASIPPGRLVYEIADSNAVHTTEGEDATVGTDQAVAGPPSTDRAGPPTP
jgi:hypothetical protein